MRGRRVLITLGILVLFIVLWTLRISMKKMAPSSGSLNNLQLRTDSVQELRGYGYGPVGFNPYVPFVEPMVLLAGLAFLAFLIQTIHSLYAAHHIPAQNPSLLGGVVDNLVPTRTRNINNSELLHEEIIKAIQIYDILNKEKKKEDGWWSTSYSHSDGSEGLKPTSTILVPVQQLRRQQQDEK